MKNDDRPIGFFDSGIGGISVLKKSIELLPNENFVYYGDSKNAPYGVKKIEEIKELSFSAVKFLIDKHSKAIVVACNTATSAAIKDLRRTYCMIPVIGIEPAVKPAYELRRNGKIVVMATPVTLAEVKFMNLIKKYDLDSEVIPLPCPGLVELIENGKFEGEEVNKYLYNRFSELYRDDIAAVVLGCTHYPFIKNELKNVIGDNIPILDGSHGTAKQLKLQLQKFNLVNLNKVSGKVSIYNSLGNDEIINISYSLLNS